MYLHFILAFILFLSIIVIFDRILYSYWRLTNFQFIMFLGMAASQPNKATTKLVNDSGEEGERPGWLEVGLRRVREQDAAEERRKKEKRNWKGSSKCVLSIGSINVVKRWSTKKRRSNVMRISRRGGGRMMPLRRRIERGRTRYSGRGCYVRLVSQGRRRRKRSALPKGRTRARDLARHNRAMSFRLCYVDDLRDSTMWIYFEPSCHFDFAM